VVSAPFEQTAKRPVSNNEKSISRKLVQRGLLALALCALIGGGAWGALRPSSVRAAAHRATNSRVSALPVQPTPAESTSINQPTTTSVVMPPGQSAGEGARPPESSRPKAVKKEYALLTVASEPWGTLFLGNKEIGPTPIADYPLPVGTHRLRIEQEGYLTKFEMIVVTGSSPIRRRYSLDPAGPP
jgi:hypothetical protein